MNDDSRIRYETEAGRQSMQLQLSEGVEPSNVVSISSKGEAESNLGWSELCGYTGLAKNEAEAKWCTDRERDGGMRQMHGPLYNRR
mmetsp:Transcript_36384/g.78760  ORF Transcript_36384/g.78760 Transcript_36384/m.78760 type:complete len:86 (-) Transcript_36384:570-827(-)